MKSTHAVPVSLLNRATYRLEHPTTVTPSGKVVATAVLNRIRRLKLENQFDLELFLQELAGMEEIAMENVQVAPTRIRRPAEDKVEDKVPMSAFIPQVSRFLETGSYLHLVDDEDKLLPDVMKLARDYIFVEVNEVDEATGEVKANFFSSGRPLAGYLNAGVKLHLGLAIIHRNPRTGLIVAAQNLVPKQRRLAHIFNSLFGAAKKNA
jgi:hypothetical protein